MDKDKKGTSMKELAAKRRKPSAREMAVLIAGTNK